MILDRNKPCACLAARGNHQGCPYTQNLFLKSYEIIQNTEITKETQRAQSIKNNKNLCVLCVFSAYSVSPE
jgi:hypothetical protein